MPSFSERFLVIEHADLSPDALQGLLEEFVSRDGTDYGLTELSLEEKCNRLQSILANNEAKIVFDTETQQVTIIDASALNMGSIPAQQDGA